MSDVQDSDWEQPDIPLPRPDPIRPAPRNALQPEKVNLRDYFEFKLAAVDEKNIMRVEALGKELAVALRASEIAVNKAEADMARRLEGMNEFRAQLNRQAGTFATKDELQAMRAAVLSEIANMRAALEAKVDAQYKIIFTIAGAVAAIQATLAFLA